MELFKLLGTIAIENAEAKRALSEVSQEGGKTESKLSKAFGVIGKGAAVAGKAIAVGLATGAAAMTGLTVKALQLSGDLEQNIGGAEQVFKELGGSIDEMSTKIITGYDEATGKAIYATSNLETVSKEAYKNMGLSQSEYLATANKMGALFQGAGFKTQEALDLSSQAMQRAADVASIMGIDTEAAMEAVAGAAKGNFTMMDNLGVAMNDTAIQNYALEKGINKTTAEMTQQEKIGLAMEMFMEKTSYAAGNYAKENETLAGSLSTAKSALTNFLAGSGDVESLVSSFSGLANVVVKSLGDIVPRLTTGLTDIVNQVAPMLPGLLNQLLPVIVQGATSLVNGLVTALPGVVSAITAALPTLIEGVATIITGIAQALPQMIQTIVAALPGVIQAIVDALPTLIPAIIDGIVQSFTAIVAALPSIIQPIIDALPDVIISIVEALVNNLPAVIEGLVQLIMGIVQALPEIIQTLIDALPTVVSLLVEALLNNLPAIIMGLIQIVMGIIAALPEIFKQLYIDLPAALWKGIFDGLGKAFSGIGEWFSETFSGAKDWAVNAWSDTKEKFEEIKNNVTEGFSDLKDKIGKKFSAAKDAAQEKWNDIKSKFNTVKDKVVSAFSDLGSNLKTKFNDAKTKALDAFDNIKEKVKEVGTNLVEGIWNGIKGAKDWIEDKIEDWVGDVTDFIKDLFGIESPSKVMRDEVGRYLAEGVAVGILENTKKATDAMKKLSNAVSKQAKLDAAKEKAQIARRLEKTLELHKNSNAKQLDIQKSNNAAQLAVDEEYSSARNKHDEELLAAAEKRLEEYQIYNELTLADEVGFWDEIRNQCTKGTDARLQADQKYFEAKQALNDEIYYAEEDLQTKLDEIYSRVQDRAKEIETTFGLFEVASIDQTDGDTMFYALHSQVSALEQYQAEMDRLGEKIGDTELFKELQSMGVGALKQVKELNSLSDYSLNYYLDMYNKRSELAKELASDELAAETAAETEKAFSEYAEKLSGLGVEIVEETAAMKTEAVSNFKAMLADFTKALEEFSPKMKLPHFSISGSLDIAEGSVPTVSVEWYKKAMNNAMLLEKPTIFGFNNASGKLMGAGEAGSEVVAGSTTLMNMIQNAVAEQNGTLNHYLQKIVELLATFFPEQIESFRNMKVQLNTGALVGELVQPMDEALGILSRRKDRGI